MTSHETNLSPKVALALVSFFLGELGDGLNIFQGIYLVALGWNEGSVGIALSMMGFTALLCQTFAGDVIDKTRLDRRSFLTLASMATAFSASAVLFVHEGNVDHAMMYHRSKKCCHRLVIRTYNLGMAESFFIGTSPRKFSV
jgi:hypothetical protein